MRRSILNLDMVPSKVWQELLQEYGTPITSTENELTQNIDELTVHTNNDFLTHEEQTALGHMPAFVVGGRLKKVYKVVGCTDGYAKYSTEDYEKATDEWRELNKCEFAADFVDYADYSFNQFLWSEAVGYKIEEDYK